MDPGHDKRVLGMVSLDDLIRAQSRSLEEERARERVLRLRMPVRRSADPKEPDTHTPKPEAETSLEEESDHLHV
jgi:hypothetical protein